MVAIPINIQKKPMLFRYKYLVLFTIIHLMLSMYILYHCPVFCAMYHLLFFLYRLSVNAMKTEGAIQNRQFIDTCNIGHKTQNKDTTNRQYNTAS